MFGFAFQGDFFCCNEKKGLEEGRVEVYGDKLGGFCSNLCEKMVR